MTIYNFGKSAKADDAKEDLFKRNHYLTAAQIAFLNTKGHYRASKYLRELLDREMAAEGFVYDPE